MRAPKWWPKFLCSILKHHDSRKLTIFVRENISIYTTHCDRCKQFLDADMRLTPNGSWETFDPVRLNDHQRKVIAANELGKLILKLPARTS